MTIGSLAGTDVPPNTCGLTWPALLLLLSASVAIILSAALPSFHVESEKSNVDLSLATDSSDQATVSEGPVGFKASVSQIIGRLPDGDATSWHDDLDKAHVTASLRVVFEHGSELLARRYDDVRGSEHDEAKPVKTTDECRSTRDGYAFAPGGDALEGGREDKAGAVASAKGARVNTGNEVKPCFGKPAPTEVNPKKNGEVTEVVVSKPSPLVSSLSVIGFVPLAAVEVEHVRRPNTAKNGTRYTARNVEQTCPTHSDNIASHRYVGGPECSFSFSADMLSRSGGQLAGLSLGRRPDESPEGVLEQPKVSNSNGDVPMVTVSFESGTYTVAEGNTTTIRVILDEDPERSVTIALDRSPQRGISLANYSGVPSSITLNSGDTERSFTFSATKEAMGDDGEGVRISIGSTLPAGVTATAPIQTTVHIADDDTAGVTFDPETVTVTEGTSSSYAVVLDSQPTHEVTVTINSPAGTEILTLQPRLTFTTDNWDIEQTVTVIANPDRDSVNDTGSITHTIDSLDDDYDRIIPGAVEVTVIDDDVPAVVVSFAQSSYTVSEGGTTTVKVVMDADPERTVNIRIFGTLLEGATSTDYSGVPAEVTMMW